MIQRFSLMDEVRHCQITNVYHDLSLQDKRSMQIAASASGLKVASLSLSLHVHMDCACMDYEPYLG